MIRTGPCEGFVSIQVQKFELHHISIIGSGNGSFKGGKVEDFLFVCCCCCLFFFLPKKCAQLFLCSLTGNLMYRQLDTCKFLDSIHFNLHVGSLLDQLACGTNMLPEFFLFVYFIYFYFVIPCFRHFKKPLNIFAEFIPQVN